MNQNYLDSNFEDKKKAINYANFWDRFVAVLIDGLIISVPLLTLSHFLGYSITDIIKEDSEEAIKSFFTFEYLVLMIFGAIVDWLYHALQESSERMATIGKRAMKLVVTDINGNRISFQQASTRFWVKYLINNLQTFTRFSLGAEISTALGFVLIANYLIQPFTEKRQTLHDIVAKTLVLKN